MDDELKHYRTPGSKNGVRKYQYPDGSLTPAGEQRYLKGRMYSPNTNDIRERANSAKKNFNTKEAFYNTGSVGPLVRAANNLRTSYKNYNEKIKNNKPSIKTPFSAKVVKKAIDYYKPYKEELDKAAYAKYTETISEMKKNKKKEIDDGYAKTNELLENVIEGLQNPEYGLFMLVKSFFTK